MNTPPQFSSPATDDNRRSSLPLNHPAVAQPKAFAEARPLQVVSIDHIDPADLMRLDPNQLDHDPILKALVTGYQQGAARAEGDFLPEWKGGRS